MNPFWPIGRTPRQQAPLDHRDLPLGTWARVTDLRSGRSVVGRINDRLGAGPQQ